MALLGFANGVTAEIACAIARAMDNTVRVEGTDGTLTLPNPWVPGRNAGPSDATLADRDRGGGAGKRPCARPTSSLRTRPRRRAGRSPMAAPGPAYPAMPARASIGNADVLDRWRHQVGCAHLRRDAADGAAARRHPAAGTAEGPDRPPARARPADQPAGARLRQPRDAECRRRRLGCLDGGRRHHLRHRLRLWRRAARDHSGPVDRLAAGSRTRSW